jgi:hypothetical protein
MCLSLEIGHISARKVDCQGIDTSMDDSKNSAHRK